MSVCITLFCRSERLGGGSKLSKSVALKECCVDSNLAS
jgi:hypothetical protein